MANGGTESVGSERHRTPVACSYDDSGEREVAIDFPAITRLDLSSQQSLIGSFGWKSRRLRRNIRQVISVDDNYLPSALLATGGESYTYVRST